MAAHVCCTHILLCSFQISILFPSIPLNSLNFEAHQHISAHLLRRYPSCPSSELDSTSRSLFEPKFLLHSSAKSLEANVFLRENLDRASFLLKSKVNLLLLYHDHSQNTSLGGGNSNIFYLHPQFGEDFSNIFSYGVKPPTSSCFECFGRHTTFLDPQNKS